MKRTAAIALMVGMLAPVLESAPATAQGVRNTKAVQAVGGAIRRNRNSGGPGPQIIEAPRFDRGPSIRETTRRHHRRGGYGINVCAFGIPGTCNWEEPAIHSVGKGHCVAGNCHGIDPRLEAWHKEAPESRQHRFEMCRTLPRYRQADCARLD